MMLPLMPRVALRPSTRCCSPLRLRDPLQASLRGGPVVAAVQPQQPQQLRCYSSDGGGGSTLTRLLAAVGNRNFKQIAAILSGSGEEYRGKQTTPVQQQVDPCGSARPAAALGEGGGSGASTASTGVGAAQGGAVEIFEVGPRDGLQNEKVHIPAASKIELVDRLSRCGFRRVEVASFVSPKWVPQMADGAEVLAGIERGPAASISYAALTPNLRGYEGARAANVDEVAIFAAASESFSQRNINCSIDESIERFAPIMEAARKDGVPVRGYVSCVAVCPYEGEVAPASVARVAGRLAELGCYEVSLGDTVGQGTPAQIEAMLEAVLGEEEGGGALPPQMLAGHYHDTNGRALENIEVSLRKGVRVFDAAVGGLGGCPYAPGAQGNVATEKVHALLTRLGYDTGLDAGLIEEAAVFARSLVSSR